MTDLENVETTSSDFSLKQIVKQSKEWFFLLLKNWYKIGLLSTLFALAGYFYAKSKPKFYAAKISFVVEETRTTSGLSSLAGQLGFDFNTGSGGSLIMGENLLLLLKSRSLTKEVLLTPYEEGKSYSLADKYVDELELRKAWKENPKINSDVYFKANATNLTRLQDSLLQGLVTGLIGNSISVDRPEKKASFVNVEVKTVSEQFSAIFTKILVQKAIDRYIAAKTKRQKTNVERLQRRADSIEMVLNNKTFVNASQQEQLLDINPATRTVAVAAELSSRDKLILMTVYGEVTKNLEYAKVALNQETPTIQIVDNIELPLGIVKKSGLTYFLICGLIGFFLSVAFFVGRKLVNESLK